jgi:NAD+ kinase
MRIGIAVRDALPAADVAAEGIRAWLLARGVECYGFAEVLESQAVDAVIVLGGDGTLLQVANQMAPREVPVLGINFGHVGYLCEVAAERIPEALERLLRGQYAVDLRTMARATVTRRGRIIRELDALNEILIGGATRTLTLDVSIDGERLGEIRGDGIIVATRTGSTAYSFSAGGSILLQDGLVLVASNAVFATSIRSLILPTSARIGILDRSWATTPYVIADGQRDYRMRKGDAVEITRSPLQVRTINLGLESSISKLSRGFGLRMQASRPSG